MASSFNPAFIKPKELPPVSRADDDLPPPPPAPLRGTGGPPPPPPKLAPETRHASPSTSFSDEGRSPIQPLPPPGGLSPPSVATPPESPSFSSSSSAFLGPPSPSTSTASGSKSKKANPFVDLLETEKIYVDTLSGIIRKIAAAWSRSNLPPPELDMMFRSVEAIFKANRSFQTKLKEIGPNPSSPRAIGDLLMKWVDQLDSPYTKYSTSYLSGFDIWEPVQSNERLPSVLESFSVSISPPYAPTWTLDALLSLPRIRIKYYQKLYNRLLKSSAPGKSTDQKLIEAVEKFEKLLAIINERSEIVLPGPVHVLETTDEVVIDTREVAQAGNKSEQGDDRGPTQGHSEDAHPRQDERDARTSFESSARGSSLSSAQRSSRDTAMTSEGRASVAALPVTLSDLERRLSTEQCQDLFSMKPRTVHLSINSPNLSYTREIRLSEDSAIHFTPKSTNVEVVHCRGHIFLLTDLFLVCEYMSFEDRSRPDIDGADMWLCYPPLAAKHLRVNPLEDTGVEVTILKREMMQLYFDSPTKRDMILKEFKTVAELAAALPPPSKQPPPPLPSVPNLSSAEPTPSVHRPSDHPGDPRSSNASPGIPSPPTGDPSMYRMDPGRNSYLDGSSPRSSAGLREPGPPPYSPSNGSGVPPQMVSPPGPRPIDQPSFAPGQFIPPQRGESSRGLPPPAGLPARPNMRDGLPPGPPSFSPGQVIPPQRAVSGHGSPYMGGMPPPRGPMSPGPMNGMNGPQRNMMSPPPMNGLNGPPRNMISPPPMHGMSNGAPPQMGPMGAPQRNGSMGPPQPRMSGPGPGPGPMHNGPRQMYRQPGPMPGMNNPQQVPHPGAPFADPGRPSSDPSFQANLRKTPSLHSLGPQHDPYQQPPRSAPPVPNTPNDYLHRQGNPPQMQVLGESNLRPMLPSAALPRIASSGPAFGLDDSPPVSPTEGRPTGPVESSVLVTTKCKVFLQQQHAQWKALGTSKLTLYEQRPTMLKQLVVEADNKDKTILISTIVLTDGIERVGKTGIAIELSDAGARTGIIYMIQMRNEKNAGDLYERLLAGSDRRSS